MEAFGSDDVKGHLRVERHGKHMVVRGNLAINAQVPCDRCTQLVPISLSPVVACVYSSIDAVPERGEADLAGGPALPEELEGVPDASEYDGIALNLADVVVESIQVEWPPRWVCEDAFPDAPSTDALCSARFAALAGTRLVDGSLNPFAPLAGWKPGVS
ncbi:MAG: hypothetical protein EXR69_12430 [Myxococcales bacterium]|nr:hypothetical protein [Myxococcales bacterium]